MASLRKRGPVWYIRYTDEHGRSVERKGSRSKRVAQEMATEAESLANRIRQGLLDPAELGLVGLAERAELRGGRLAARREGATWVLHGWLPWAA